MPVYTGSARSFSAFDPSLAGSTTGVAPARTAAAWVSPDPEVANEFAELAGTVHEGGRPQVYPLYHWAKNPTTVVLDGTEKNMEVAGTLMDLFEAGHDAVMLKNYTTPGGKSGRKIIAIRSPEQLRSRFAVFDPAKKSSADLLAGLGGVGATGLLGQLLLTQPAQDDRQGQ